MKPHIVFGLALAAVSASAATFTVSNTADSGAGSLRQAMLNANSTAGSDQIHFPIGGGGAQTKRQWGRI